MAENTIKGRLIMKHGSSTDWVSASSFIPKQGELIIYDTGDATLPSQFKIGDGTRTVGALPFANISQAATGGSSLPVYWTGSGFTAISTLGVANGGTGATTAAAARSNLGLDSIAKTYNTVADMIAAASNFSKGDTIETNGYYTSGDGGGAQYTIWQGTVESTDTAFSIQLTSTLAASVIRNGNNFNVLQYGVKNDGETDVTDMVNLIFTQAPHDSTIYFPAGEYKFTAPIVPNRLAAIKGDISTIFKDNTWISSNTSGTIFNFDVSSMPDFSTYAESDYGTTITYNSKTYKLDHDGFSFLNYGLTNTGRMGVNIENIFFNCNSYDVSFDASKYNSTPGEVFSETIVKPKINCIKMGANFTIQNCTFDGWSGYALTGWTNGTEDGYSSWSAWNHIDRCYFVHCKYGILSAIDSQFMNLRFNECYVGIVDNGSANMFTNVRMDSIGMYGIKMEGNQCTASTIIGLDVDVGYGPGLVVHGNNHYIQGHIGRCGGKSTGKTQSEITYDDFPYSCSVLLDDNGDTTCKNNKIDVILTYEPVYEYADTETLANAKCPAILIGATKGEYENIGLNITSPQTPDNTDILFTNVLMAQPSALNAPSDAGKALFKGNLTINGENYCIEDKTTYPFERNSVTLNNFFMGFSRDADTRLPNRLGTMMEHYWKDRYCLSIWNASKGSYEWIDIKNPAIDTSIHEENATASAKETGTELGILRQRIGNLENALGASNITDITYPEAWKTVGTTSRSEFSYNFSSLDLENNEIEIKVDLSNAATDSTKPSDGSAFIRFVDGTEENLWNNTGWVLYYAGINYFQSFLSNLHKGTSIWGGSILQGWSTKMTIRINRQGILINNKPVQVTDASHEVSYRDTIKDLISDMVAAGTYNLYICGNENVIIESIKLINYNMTDTSLGGVGGVLPIVQGGTGATTASTARTNLGITSGTTLPSSGSVGDIFLLYST